MPSGLRVVSLLNSVLFFLFKANEVAPCVAMSDLGCQRSACTDWVAFTCFGTNAPIVPRWRQRWATVGAAPCVGMSCALVSVRG